MMQRRGYFISRYDSTVFRTWGQKQFKQALRLGHRPIYRKEWERRLAWHIQRGEVLAAA